MLQVGTDVKLKSMVKSVNPNTPTIWYGQVRTARLASKVTSTRE